MKLLKGVLIVGLMFGSLHLFADAAGELQIYNRVKDKSWDQLDSQERSYAQQNGITSPEDYARWKSQYEPGGSRASQVSSESMSTGPGINEAAAEAAAAQKAAAMKNMAVGAALLATGMAGCQGMKTWGCPLIPMSALAFMQAGHDSNAGGLSDLTFDESTQTDDGDTNTDGDNSEEPGSTGFTKKVNDNIKKTQQLGAKVDSDLGIVTAPDGSTYPTSAFSSPASMAAAGMSPEAIAAAQKALAEGGETTLASVGAMGVETAAGGGGGGGGSYSASSSSALDDYFASLRKGKKDKDRMVAGKSLNYGKDPIGVKADNIFMMVHRRYQGKRKINSYFLERAPASVNSPRKKAQGAF